MQPNRPTAAHRPVVLLLAAGALLAACRGAEGSTEQAADVPTRSGDVWELDSASSRASAPAALVAFVNGMHVIIVDGDDVFAGSQQLAATAGEGDARTFALGGDLTAQLAADGDAAMSLRFSSGETARLHRQPAHAQEAR